MPPTSPQSSSLTIPIAIIVGFALIAGAVYFSGSRSGVSSATAPSPDARAAAADRQNAADRTGEIRPITEDDYIRGNPNAPIMIVEYSDYDCPFCKTFHTTMKQIMDEYGVTGEVGWVYRQYPIQQLHPNAPRISEAALCVGELGGNEAFWKFSDLVFENRGERAPTNVTRLPEYAVSAGVSEAEYQDCLESGRQRERVEMSIEDGFTAGIDGTPNSFILIGNQQASIEGAQPYSVVKQIIEDLLGQLEGRRPGTSTEPAS